MRHDDNLTIHKLLLPLKPEDGQMIFNLDQFINPGSWTLQNWLLLRENYFLCAVSKRQGMKDSIVGVLLGFEAIPGDVGHLIKIVMHPEMRRLGGAKLMLEFYLEHLRSAGARSLYLEVAITNLPAITFYRRAGLKDLCVKKKFYQNGEDALSMELLLS